MYQRERGGGRGRMMCNIYLSLYRVSKVPKLEKSWHFDLHCFLPTLPGKMEGIYLMPGNLRPAVVYVTLVYHVRSINIYTVSL